jgi:hypothetical protein
MYGSDSFPVNIRGLDRLDQIIYMCGTYRGEELERLVYGCDSFPVIQAEKGVSSRVVRLLGGHDTKKTRKPTSVGQRRGGRGKGYLEQTLK